MKKTDAHAFVFASLQDHVTNLEKTGNRAAAIALAEKLKVAMDALGPSPEEPAKIAEGDGHG